MKKMTKIVGVMAIIAMLLLGMATISSASATNVDPAGLANQLHGTTKGNVANQVTGIGNQLIGIITTVGVVVAVIILLVLGIKYMMGSASEKAEYKKTMIPYIVGAILIFGASAITQVVVSLASSFNG